MHICRNIALKCRCHLFSTISKTTPMIVPIIIGTHNETTIKKIADALKTIVYN